MAERARVFYYSVFRQVQLIIYCRFVIKIYAFSKRTITLKALDRLLIAFRINLSLSTPAAIKTFTETMVQVGPSVVKGVQALEIGLHRIVQARVQNQESSNSTIEAFSTGYAGAVLDDDLRLEAITCISLIMNIKAGMAVVLSTAGIIKQIVSCLSNPYGNTSGSVGGGANGKLASDIRLRTSNLLLRIKVAEVVGPLCLISDKGLR